MLRPLNKLLLCSNIWYGSYIKIKRVKVNGQPHKGTWVYLCSLLWNTQNDLVQWDQMFSTKNLFIGLLWSCECQISPLLGHCFVFGVNGNMEKGSLWLCDTHKKDCSGFICLKKAWDSFKPWTMTGWLQDNKCVRVNKSTLAEEEGRKRVSLGDTMILNIK